MSRFVSARRRRLLAAAPAAIVASSAAWAQGLSKRTVRFIIPFTTSTGPDIVARILAPAFQTRWDQAFIVDNRPGASGTIGTEAVVKSPPDGHTMMIGPASIVTAPHLYAKIGYHVINDLTPIALVGSTGLALAVHPSMPATLPEFVAYVRARPGQLNYASPGNGTHHHLCMELLKVSTGLDIVHVPYKGSGPAVTDTLAGQTQVMFPSIVAVSQHVKSGKLRALAVTGRSRSPLFPTLPTVAESGLAGFDVSQWYGILAPARTPREVIAKLHDEIVAAMNDPETQKRFAAQGADVVTSTPEAFGKFVAAEVERWGKFIRATNIKAD